MISNTDIKARRGTPSTDKLHHFVPKKKSDMRLMTCDMWHVTRDTWHVTSVMWHMTCDMLCGLNTLSKFQLPSSYCLWYLILWRYSDMISAPWVNCHLWVSWPRGQLSELPYWTSLKSKQVRMSPPKSLKYSHILSHKIIVAVALKFARLLLKRLRKASWNFETQFTHVLDILELRAKYKTSVK